MNTDSSILDLDLSKLSQIDDDSFKNFFDDMMADKGTREQSVVTGRVIGISDDWVTVDISFKAEGLIPAAEFRGPDGEMTIAVGDTVDVYLDSMGGDDGVLYLSKEKADLMKAWEEISQAVQRDEVVEGQVIARVKGGLQVDIGVKAFLPGSQVDLRPVKNLDKLLGETFQFKIIKFNKKRGNIVLSRRVLLEQEREEKREETLKSLTIGAIMTGIVKNITDYGAFVDLGGIDGLLHITDMSYGRLEHPSQMFEVGQAIEVKILKYDPDSQRVSLGFKQIRPDPWEEAEYKYPVGAIVRGKVVSIPDYGAFIELEDGIEGLVHISEMTWDKKVKHPSKLVNVGDVIEAKVLGMDVVNKRISLGMKQLEPNPWDVVEQRYPAGSIVQGKVRNITDFGIFVGIDEGIDGLVHISDLSWGQRIRHPSERYQKGDEVEARVLDIDIDKHRFSLGIKQLTQDPWFTVHNRYMYGQVVEGPVVHVTDFGVFVELEDGVEGLVHLSELAHDGDDWHTHYPENKAIRAEVVHIDPELRRISLSERGALERAEGDVDGYMQRQGDAAARLGDVMGDLSAKFGGDES
ncbi:MAG: 30S ribosomal protein S1 [Alphaproteobacteria bacterium]|nr:30S ribosomal protein S1 [Alphaproteobacteria bacterium]MCB9690532.1 30S ribosomal protein S1 [Alphaproteobacteria bacterium]